MKGMYGGFGCGAGGYGWRNAQERGNPYPYCRCNPDLPSRRAIAVSSCSEEKYLRDMASMLQKRLDYINGRLAGKKEEKE